LSGLLIAVGLLVRLRIVETPLFAAVQEQEQVAESPVREVIRRHWGKVLLAAGARLTENACFYLFAVFTIAYGTKELKVEESVMLRAVMIAAAAELATIPMFGVLSDWWGRRGTYMAGCVFLALFALPFFALLNTREPVWIVLAIVLGMNLGHAVLYSVQASLIPELFGTRLRCTGASLGYQLAVPFAGGLAPIIAAWLVERFRPHYWPLAAYVILMSLI